MENERYYNLNDLDFVDYIRAIRLGDKRIMMHMVRKGVSNLTSGVVSTGVDLPENVARLTGSKK